jgi:hypothetical protein
MPTLFFSLTLLSRTQSMSDLPTARDYKGNHPGWLSGARRAASSASYLSSRWLTMDAATSLSSICVSAAPTAVRLTDAVVSGSHLGPKR